MGEELTSDEKEQMRKRMEEQMKQRDRAKLEERMQKMQDMMKKMPLEMNAVIRNQMLVACLSFYSLKDIQSAKGIGLLAVWKTLCDDSNGS